MSVVDQFGNAVTEDEDLKVVEALESLTQHPGWQVFLRQLQANVDLQRMRLERPEVKRQPWQTIDYLQGACFAFRTAGVLPQVARKQYNDNQERLRMDAEIEAEDKQKAEGPTGPPFRESAIPDDYDEESQWH